MVNSSSQKFMQHSHTKASSEASAVNRPTTNKKLISGPEGANSERSERCAS